MLEAGQRGDGGVGSPSFWNFVSISSVRDFEAPRNSVMEAAAAMLDSASASALSLSTLPPGGPVERGFRRLRSGTAPFPWDGGAQLEAPCAG